MGMGKRHICEGDNINRTEGKGDRRGQVENRKRHWRKKEEKEDMKEQIQTKKDKKKEEAEEKGIGKTL